MTCKGFFQFNHHLLNTLSITGKKLKELQILAPQSPVIVLSCPLIGCWATERANWIAAQHNYILIRSRSLRVSGFVLIKNFHTVQRSHHEKITTRFRKSFSAWPLNFWCILRFCYQRILFWDRDNFCYALSKHSFILCHNTRGFTAHDNTHMHLWMWNSFEMIIPIPKESYLCTEGFI